MTKFKNGSLVQVLGVYPCVGQVCSVKNYEFIGEYYEFVVLESALFQKGEIIGAFGDLLVEYRKDKV